MLAPPCPLLTPPPTWRGSQDLHGDRGRVATILDGTAPGTPDPPVSPLRADESWWGPLLEVEVEGGAPLLEVEVEGGAPPLEVFKALLCAMDCHHLLLIK
jgi:hypothetical protein